MTATQQDDFWQWATRMGYRQLPQGAALTPIEEAALLPLRLAWSGEREDAYLDQHWGVTTDRSNDDAWTLLPLTLSNVDAFAARVWADPRDHDGTWSVKP